MIRYITISWIILLLVACDNSGGSLSHDEKFAPRDEQPSTPVLKVQAIPTSITSGTLVTVTGVAWDDTSDINDIVWTSDHLVLVSQSLQRREGDSEDDPVNYTATFQAEQVIESTQALLKGQAVSDLGTESKPINIRLSVQVNKTVTASKPTVTFVDDLSQQEILYPHQSLTLRINTYSTTANVKAIKWESDNTNLTLSGFDPVREGSSDSSEKPLLLTATFIAQNITSAGEATINVTVIDDGQIPEQTMEQYNIELRPLSTASINTVTKNKIKTGAGFAKTQKANDKKSEGGKVTQSTIHPFPSHYSETSQDEKSTNNPKDKAMKVEEVPLTKDKTTSDSDENTQPSVIKPKKDRKSETQSSIAQRSGFSTGAQPVIHISSTMPKNLKINPTKEVTVTVNTYSVNGHVNSIKWQSMNKNLVLKNAQKIPSGSEDSKERPLQLSATFETQDFSAPSSSQIAVTVQDDAMGSSPETKRINVSLQPWSAPTIVEFHVPSEIGAGKDLDVTLVAYDKEDDIEKVEWFTDKANLITPPSTFLVPNDVVDSQQSPFTFDGDYVGEDTLLHNENVKVWAKISTHHGQSIMTPVRTVVIKQLTKPVVTEITDVFDGLHAHLNPDQPKQDRDQIVLYAKANTKSVSEHGEGEVKIKSYYWSQSSDDPIRLNIDSSPQTIDTPDSEVDIPPLSITLPDSGKQGSDSPTDYHIQLVVVDERGVESEAKDYKLTVDPRSQLKLMTINVYLIKNALARESRVKEYIRLKDELFSFNDVVALNEAFSNSLTQKLVNGLGFPYKTEVLGNKLGNLLNGGVVVLSRYPIIESHEYIYSSSCAEDSFANKGFIHVKIRKDGRLYNIIATHTQADPVLPCSDVARVRENQFREIRQYIEEKIQDRSEYLYVIGDLNTDQTYSEFNNMLSILDVEQPEYAGLKYSWDFRLNTLASKSYYDYEGSPLRFDYLFSVNGFAQPRAWHNIILDPIVKTRIEHDDGISHFHFVDPSDHFPAIGFEYLDGTIPERSFRGQNKRYDSIRFKHQLTGSYLRAGAENDYVFIQPQQGERDNEWAIDTFYPSYWLANDTQAFPTCILNDMGVEVESLKYKGKFLVWDLFYPSYYVLGSTSSKWLTIEKVDENDEPAAGCIEDGDKVFIKDATDVADWSFAKQYISKDISYFRVNDYRNEADTFIVEMPKANLLDWSNLPR